MDVPLDPEIERVVLEKVESGEYPSVAALVEEALFLLVQRDWAARQSELLAKMPGAFGADPGPSTDSQGP